MILGYLIAHDQNKSFFSKIVVLSKLATFLVTLVNCVFFNLVCFIKFDQIINWYYKLTSKT